MYKIVKKLITEGTLTLPEYHQLLSGFTKEMRLDIASAAREVTLANFGNKIFTRGLIEVTNICKNNCYYCGIRAGNRDLVRFRLSKEEILSCCRQGYALDFRTFVLQGGEDPHFTADFMVDVVSTIRESYPDCAITLSMGEWDKASYQRFFDAGADRYLLRHETHNADHYGKLHPTNMTISERLSCLHDLQAIGFQTGTGIMVGSPGQTIDHLVEDIAFVHSFNPEMIGIGPFLPHHSTPFAHEAKGSLEMTLLLISIFRLMFPKANIPATTSMATIEPTGREQGIFAGANVVMPNLSPQQVRAHYALYDNKVATNEEAAESRAKLQARMEAIGYSLSDSRGDYGDTLLR